MELFSISDLAQLAIYVHTRKLTTKNSLWIISTCEFHESRKKWDGDNGILFNNQSERISCGMEYRQLLMLSYHDKNTFYTEIQPSKNIYDIRIYMKLCGEIIIESQ